ncbi:hypothetical protein Bca52824_019219 [Brassica carinata]|uniref:Ribosomal protein L7/L12 C-terminal domain-containing protein n=1 Tax=Brassica carinata TaxID=52824 RepID=A0A8X7VS11_BRACI|nr:hypothetical protein Bca52824_019219 [Brassica carinata]
MKKLISLVKNVHSRQYQPKVNWSVQVRFLQQDSFKIMELTERISALSPQERKLISPALNEHLRLPMISTQGMSMGAKQEAGTGKTEEKKEKTKVTVVIKQGLTKEEANGIIEKIKALGGVAVME